MLPIREEQLEAFREAARARRLDETLAWARRHFSPECHLLGERTRDAIAEGLAHAEELGFRLENNARRFVALRLVFGPEFDRDPACAWAADIVSDTGATETARMDRLFDAGMHALPDEDLA